MKRQLLFFLLLFSCAMYAMEYDHAIDQLTSQQIARALDLYCLKYPMIVNPKEAKKEIDRIRTTQLTFADKKDIVGKMRNFPVPVMIENQLYYLSERDGYEELTSVERVH